MATDVDPGRRGESCEIKGAKLDVCYWDPQRAELTR